jgi:hypothetical protein
VSTRKSSAAYSAKASAAVPPAPRTRSRKKAARPPRVRLTHFEVRRGDTVRLRVAVADDALAEIGDELGALIRRIAPSTQVTVVEPVEPIVTPITESVSDPVVGPELILSREHGEHDAVYHAELRDHLEALFGSLCDAALDDALDVARKERDRRAEGGN